MWQIEFDKFVFIFALDQTYYVGRKSCMWRMFDVNRLDIEKEVSSSARDVPTRDGIVYIKRGPRTIEQNLATSVHLFK